MIYSLLDLLDIDLPWRKELLEDKNNLKKRIIIEKSLFKIEDYIPKNLKILSLIFNDLKRKNEI